MWRWWRGLGLLLAALAAGLPARSARAQGAERIVDYQVVIAIRGDGTIRVVERIDYDFGSAERHGVLRDIPVRLPYDDRFDRIYRLEVESVRGSPGTPARLHLEREGGTLRIRIGDPDRTVTGRHTYTIAYRVEGALNGFPDHDELYWNAIGTEWSVPIERASVRVTGPARFLRVACFAGPFRSTLPCASGRARGSTATFAQTGLGPSEGLTVVVGLPKGVVPPPQPILEERWAIQRAFSVTPLTAGLAGTLLLLLLAGVGRVLWVVGRDRRARGSAVAVAFAETAQGEQPVPLLEHPDAPVEYAPPEGIRPGEVGTLVDEVAGPLDATATIVDLAVRGYLRIEEIPKRGWFGKPDWRLVQLKDPDRDLVPYERLLLQGLFLEAEGDPHGAREVLLSSLKQRVAGRLREVERALYEDVVERGWFAGRPDRVRQLWHGVGAAVFAAGVGLTALLAWKTHLGLVPVPIAAAGLLLLWGSRWMPRRTPKGTGMVRRVMGFRRYMATAEVQEARFAERENLFSRYLPYAVVFGMTDKWARAFADLEGRPPPTSWYVGPHPFTVASFSDSIDGFSVTTAGTIASTPAASGGSGFGGGGFSGGGGGGGGGGSW